MDIRAYFHKLRETERSIGPEWVVVVSNDTPNGGKAGRLIEVSRASAAKTIIDGSARLATEEETQNYRDDVARDVEQAQAEEEARRVHLMFTTEKPERPARGGKQKG
ncbi:MAG: hypothetical protein SGI92_09220 [Bryobacteraceae bacterium]|nr:hypothetical protein [Bryobacteraceae bacterium]